MLQCLLVIDLFIPSPKEIVVPILLLSWDSLLIGKDGMTPHCSGLEFVTFMDLRVCCSLLLRSAPQLRKLTLWQRGKKPSKDPNISDNVTNSLADLVASCQFRKGREDEAFSQDKDEARTIELDFLPETTAESQLANSKSMSKAGHSKDVEVDEHFAPDTVAGEPQNVLDDPDGIGSVAAVDKSVPELGPEIADGCCIANVAKEWWPVLWLVNTAAHEYQCENVMEPSVETDRVEDPVGN